MKSALGLESTEFTDEKSEDSILPTHLHSMILDALIVQYTYVARQDSAGTRVLGRREVIPRFEIRKTLHRRRESQRLVSSLSILVV